MSDLQDRIRDDQKAAMKAARDHVEAVKKRDNPEGKVRLIPARDDKQDLGAPARVGGTGWGSDR